eukprot:EG_transcript_30933
MHWSVDPEASVGEGGTINEPDWCWGPRQDSLQLRGPGHAWPPKTCFDPLMQVQTPKHTLQGPSKGGGRIFQPAFSSLVDLQPSVEPHVFESIQIENKRHSWVFLSSEGLMWKKNKTTYPFRMMRGWR